MRNREIWQESKYVWAKGGLKASADVLEVRIESRFLGDILALAYASAIRRHARGRMLDLGCGKAPLYGVYRGCNDLWREIARLLASGGKLILGAPFLYGVHEDPYDYFRWAGYLCVRSWGSACPSSRRRIFHLATTWSLKRMEM
jgi:hypothetical protein